MTGKAGCQSQGQIQEEAETGSNDLLLQHRIMQAQIGCGPQGLCLERVRGCQQYQADTIDIFTWRGLQEL